MFGIRCNLQVQTEFFYLVAPFLGPDGIFSPLQWMSTAKWYIASNFLLSLSICNQHNLKISIDYHVLCHSHTHTHTHCAFTPIQQSCNFNLNLHGICRVVQDFMCKVQFHFTREWQPRSWQWNGKNPTARWWVGCRPGCPLLSRERKSMHPRIEIEMEKWARNGWYCRMSHHHAIDSITNHLSNMTLI